MEAPNGTILVELSGLYSGFSTTATYLLDARDFKPDQAVLVPSAAFSSIIHDLLHLIGVVDRRSSFSIKDLGSVLSNVWTDRSSDLGTLTTV